MSALNISTKHIWSTEGNEFIAAVVVLGLVSTIGFVGNVIVVYTILTSPRPGQWSAVQLFLLHLAISDLLVCIVCIPLTIWVNFYFPEVDKPGANGVCKLTRFVQFLAPSSSICLLAVISIDRYYSLARPLETARAWVRPKVLITVGWIYGSAIFLPTFYFAKTERVQSNGGNRTLLYCRTIPNNTRAGFLYLLFLLVFGFAAQLAIIIVLYSRVGKAVWSRSRKMMLSGIVVSGNVASFGRTKKRVTRLLVSVVICFFLCWAPFVIYSGFVERFVAPFPNPADPIRFFTYVFGLSNSVCNPFIYLFNAPSFHRDSFRKMCLDTVAFNRNAGQFLNETKRTTKSLVACAGTSSTVARLRSTVIGIESQVGMANNIYDNQSYDTRL